jgi:hypothetical protein
MPIRTYTNIDFIDYAAVETLNNGTNTAVVVPSSQFNVSASGNGSDTIGAPGSIESSVNLTYDMSGNLDFDAFPAIPDNALITRIDVQIDVEGNANAVANVTGLDSTNVNANSLIAAYTFINSGQLPDIQFQEAQNDDAPGELQASVSISGEDHYTATQTFDYTGSPISKASLVADFTAWFVQLRMYASAQAIIGALSVSTGDTDETAGITFAGIRITVTYESGPEISLSPSGGNVEIGQQIVATGPVENLEFAAIIGDKVVPIEPKVISPTEVWLEVPYPPTDPCFDCFGDCPNCDDCFDTCNEDLIGEACQECMQECLDCLTACLENLQLAEECQQSSGSQTPPTIIVIVCGTEFSGTVTLGNFTIIEANGSGIYRFVTGKTEDTIYDSARDGETHDVKIPNPGAKTGFFRS